jgi:hypothetical protein
MATLETVLRQASRLSTIDKVRLIEKVTPQIERELVASQQRPAASYPSLLGICQDLGTAPSAEEIDTTREEFLAGFPREDIA